MLQEILIVKKENKIGGPRNAIYSFIPVIFKIRKPPPHFTKGILPFRIRFVVGAKVYQIICLDIICYAGTAVFLKISGMELASDIRTDS